MSLQTAIHVAKNHTALAKAVDGVTHAIGGKVAEYLWQGVTQFHAIGADKAGAEKALEALANLAACAATAAQYRSRVNLLCKRLTTAQFAEVVWKSKAQSLDKAYTAACAMYSAKSKGNKKVAPAAPKGGFTIKVDTVAKTVILRNVRLTQSQAAAVAAYVAKITGKKIAE